MKNALREIDLYPVNCLKEMKYRSIPGAILSILLTLLLIVSLAGCLFYYYFQKAKVSLKYEPLTVDPSLFPTDQKDIQVGITEINATDLSLLEFVTHYYRMTAFFVKD